MCSARRTDGSQGGCADDTPLSSRTWQPEIRFAAHAHGGQTTGSRKRATSSAHTWISDPVNQCQINDPGCELTAGRNARRTFELGRPRFRCSGMNWGIGNEGRSDGARKWMGRRPSQGVVSTAVRSAECGVRGDELVRAIASVGAEDGAACERR